jgi:hypothetical protein
VKKLKRPPPRQNEIGEPRTETGKLQRFELRRIAAANISQKNPS